MALPTLVERLAALPAFTRLLSALPGGRGTAGAAGLVGSSDAVLVAALAERQPNRMLVVVADQLPEAERWLADLAVLSNDYFSVPVEDYDFALAYNDSYLKRHQGDIEGSLKATAIATKRAFPDKFPEDIKKPAGSPAGTVEGGTAPVKGSTKYTVSRLTADQKLAHDQYIKAGTFDAVAKAAKMTPTEYYVKELENINELTK